MKLHRKIKHNKKVCPAHDLGSYAQGQGRNQFKGQNLVSAITRSCVACTNFCLLCSRSRSLLYIEVKMLSIHFQLCLIFNLAHINSKFVKLDRHNKRCAPFVHLFLYQSFICYKSCFWHNLVPNYMKLC